MVLQWRGLQASQTLFLCLVLSLFTPLTIAADSVGTAERVVGDINAQRNTEQPRKLENGASLYSGDLITTPSDGFVELALADGSRITLRPDTEFRIDEFQFGKAAEERGFFSLIKGGFKTVTGLIGKSNRDDYKVSTPIAFIGIRGTEYSARLCGGGDCVPATANALAAALGLADPAPPGLYGSVQAGATSVTNNAGEAVFSAGQSFHVADADSAAQESETSGFADDEFADALAEQHEANNDPGDFPGSDAGGGGDGH